LWIAADARGQVTTVSLGDFGKGVAVSPDGSRVFVTNFDSTQLAIVNPANGSVSRRPLGVEGDTSPGDVAVSPDGSRAYVVNSFEATVAVIDTAGREQVATIPVGSFT